MRKKNNRTDLKKQAALEELKKIPWVGERISEVLYDMGFRSASDFKGRDPEDLYFQLCAQEGAEIDRCMLYVFRCIVYYASREKHNPELLKWWKWKDK